MPGRGSWQRYGVWLLLTASFVRFLPRGSDASCSGLCCPGSDLACSSWGWRTDRTYGTCYCDRSCTRSRDCCFDYQLQCPAQPCVLSEWSQWSGCARPCQPSYRVRTRSVLTERWNSGQECPALEQRAGCMEYRNHQGQPCALDREAALITTAEYSRARSEDSTSLCVEFELLSVSRVCAEEQRSHSRWTQYLREGFVVCVRCRPPAFSNHNHSCRGDGRSTHTNQLLHWQAVGNPACRGTWRKTQQLHHCSCPQVHTFIFI